MRILVLLMVSALFAETADDYLIRHSVGARSVTPKSPTWTSNQSRRSREVVQKVLTLVNSDSVCGYPYMASFTTLLRLSGQTGWDIRNKRLVLAPNAEFAPGVFMTCRATGVKYLTTEGNPEIKVDPNIAPTTYEMFFSLPQSSPQEVKQIIQAVVKAFPDYSPEIMTHDDLNFGNLSALDGLYLDGPYQTMSIYQFKDGFLLSLLSTLGILITANIESWQKILLSYYIETDIMETRFQEIGFIPSEDPSLFSFYSTSTGIRVRLNMDIGACPQGSEWESTVNLSSMGVPEFTHRTLNPVCIGLVPGYGR